MNIGTLTVLLGANTAGLTRAATNMRRFETQVIGSNKRIAAFFAHLGSKMALTGTVLTQTVTVPMVALGVAATSTFAKFEYQLGKIVGLTGIAASKTKEWAYEMLGMAGQVGQTPKKLAEALYYITSSGIRGAESMDILKNSALAATGGLGEVKTVADMVTSAINAYGKENLTAKHALDVFISAIREGKGEPEEYAHNLGKIFPIATKLGVSIEDVGAAMAALTRTGTSVSEAATQVRRLLVTLIQQPPKAVEELNKLKEGLDFNDLIQTMQQKGLLGMLIDLKKIVGDNVEAWGDLFPNIRALLPVLDMLGPNLESTKEIFEALNVKVDSLGNLTKTISGTVSFRWKQAMGSMSASLIKFGGVIKEPLIGLVTGLANKFSELADGFAKLPREQQGTIIAFTAMATVLGPLLLILGQTVVAIQAIGRALFGLQLASWIFKILALGAAVYYTYKNWDLLKQALERFSLVHIEKQLEKQKEKLSELQAKWQTYFEELRSSGQMTEGTVQYLEAYTKAEEAVDSLQNKLSQLPKTAFDERENVASQIVGKLNELFELRKKLSTGMPGSGKETVSNAMLMEMRELEKILTFAKVDQALLDEKEELTSFGDFFKKIFSSMATDAADAFNNLQKTFTGFDLKSLGGGGFNLGNEEEIRRIMTPLEKIKKFQEGWTKMTLAKTPGLSRMVNDFDQVAPLIDRVTDNLRQNEQVAKKLGDTYDKTAEDIRILQEGLGELLDPKVVKQMDTKAVEQVQKLLVLLKQLQQEADAISLEELNKKLELLGNNTELLNEKQRLLSKTWTKILMEDLPKDAKGISNWVERLKVAGQALDEIRTKLELQAMLKNALEGTFTAIATGIGNALSGVDDAMKTFLISFLGIVQQMGEALIGIGTGLMLIGNIAMGLKYAAGGAVIVALSTVAMNAVNAKKMATGGVIPPGYPNDTFPALLSSGEEVLPSRVVNSLVNMNAPRRQQQVKFVVEGRELVGVLENMNTFNKSF